MAEALPDTCWLFDPHARHFVLANAAGLRRAGCSEAELRASPQSWLTRVHADDRPAVQAALAGLAEGRPYSLQYRCTDADGATSWIEEQTRFVGRLQDAGCRVVGLSRDITAHKRFECGLQAALDSKDEFLAILMHELRTPLQSIRAASEVLKKTQSSPARIIERQVQQLTRLVEDLGESTRVTHGRVHLRPEKLNLRRVLQDAIDGLRAGFDERQLAVQFEAPAVDVWVHGDPARLAQVFGNLLHNAAKFSAADGAVFVTIARVAGAPAVTVSVRDEGAGIASDSLDAVFDLFTQRTPTPARLRSGLGIGLSVVRSLVELQGGHVTVHSDGPGTGSCFVVTLPVVDAPAATGTHRILLVEDNPDAATSLQELLRLDGHEVLVASDGRSGLLQAAAWQPDTVVLDLELPDLDGREVAQRLRADRVSPRPRLIALSGAGQPDWHALQAAGFDFWLEKPACLSDLSVLLDA